MCVEREEIARDKARERERRKTKVVREGKKEIGDYNILHVAVVDVWVFRICVC